MMMDGGKIIRFINGIYNMAYAEVLFNHIFRKQPDEELSLR
jgi:hypothetical protein